jgi:hypothetical protein
VRHMGARLPPKGQPGALPPQPPTLARTLARSLARPLSATWTMGSRYVASHATRSAVSSSPPCPTARGEGTVPESQGKRVPSARTDQEDPPRLSPTALTLAPWPPIESLSGQRPTPGRLIVDVEADEVIEGDQDVTLTAEHS